MTWDLVVRGGTVVTATGSRVADVAVDGGAIVAIDADLGDQGANARETVDATGLWVLPGAVDAHTHTRVATDAEPDRFFQDSVAAAFGGTTTFLAFNNPGTGSSPAAERSLRTGLREWRAAVAGDSAVDVGISLAVSGRMDDPIGELERIVDEGAPTAKAFMVFDFRLDDRRLFDALRVLGARGGMLQVHCEDPVLIDTAVAAALQHGDVAARYHAATRSRDAEAVATRRAMAFARATGSPVHVVHLSSAEALRHVRDARAAGVSATAETCPHYLVHDASVYDQPDDLDVARFVISPPIRPAEDREALWAGLADGALSLVATDHVPDRLDREKGDAVRGVPFDRISNGAPGIETLLTTLYSEGVAKGRLTPERLVDLLATTPARRFGLPRKGAIAKGFDADLVLFDPATRRTVRAIDLHHTSDYTPYEGLDVTGAVRGVFVRGRAVIRDGAFVGERGWGRIPDRAPVPLA
jgi:dihydropyrimidinase